MAFSVRPNEKRLLAVEPVRDGYGEGAFVVLSTEKI